MSNTEDISSDPSASSQSGSDVGVPRLVLPIGKKLRYAFNVVLSEVENARCENLHHAKKHQHKSGELCPVEYHIQRQAFLVREFLRQNV